MSYVDPTEETGLSSKEKDLKCIRGRSFYRFMTKISIFVGLIKSQIISMWH